MCSKYTLKKWSTAATSDGTVCDLYTTSRSMIRSRTDREVTNSIQHCFSLLYKDEIHTSLKIYMTRTERQSRSALCWITYSKYINNMFWTPKWRTAEPSHDTICDLHTTSCSQLSFIEYKKTRESFLHYSWSRCSHCCCRFVNCYKDYFFHSHHWQTLLSSTLHASCNAYTVLG
jgi:hypothetical protein